MVESGSGNDFRLSQGVCASATHREPEASRANVRDTVSKTSNSRSYHNLQRSALLLLYCPSCKPLLANSSPPPGAGDLRTRKNRGSRRDLERRGLSRALVVTTLAGFPCSIVVTAAMGSRCAGVFGGIVQHVPRGTVNALEAEIERVNADCLVSFGGGSPIDSAKVAIYGLLNKAQGARELMHIAVPTTLSAAEYTYAGGVTDEASRVKGGVYDPRVLPAHRHRRSVLLLHGHAGLAVGLHRHARAGSRHRVRLRHPPSAHQRRAGVESHRSAGEASTGVDQNRPARKAPAHRGPLPDGGLVLHLRRDEHALRPVAPAGTSDRAALERPARHHQLHHSAARHAVHGGAGAPDRFGPIAEGFGIPFDPGSPKPAALACADKTAEFIALFDVPRTLKAAGVPREEIGQIVEPITHELEKMGVTDRPLTRGEVLGLLEASYS